MSNTNTEEWGNVELPGLNDEKLFGTNWNRVAAGLENKNNKKLLELAKQKSQDPKFSNTMKEVSAQRDDAYTKALHNGIAKRDNSYQAECNSRPEVRAKISSAMKQYTKTAEHEAKVAESNKQKPNNPIWKQSHAAGLARRDRPFWAGEYSEQISAPFASRAEAARYAASKGLKNAVKKMEGWTKKFPEHYFFMD